MAEKIIWFDKKGNIVSEKDAYLGKIWINGIPVFVIPKKSKAK